MSEFRCRYGHIMLSSHGRWCPVCRECGRWEGVYTMDGRTNRELVEEERDGDQRETTSESSTEV